MPELFFWIAVFVISLIVLIKASDFFTVSAEKIGLYFGMPAFIVGVTIVAIGTSLPELISSIFAVLQGASEIVVGNVIGSNIANIFLILGIAALIGKKIKISYELIHVDLPILVASAFLFMVMIWDGTFTIGEGILSIIGIAIYFLYTTHSDSKDKEKLVKREIELKKKKLEISAIVVLIVSAVFIFIGARYTVESIIELSKLLNIGTEIIAISVVALGTSLPELMVTVSAVRRGNAEMAVGNILGSNIFNTFAVMGIPALFGALVIPQNIIAFGLPMMIIATLLFFFMTQEKEITNWEGYVLLLFYVFFIGKLFNLF